MTNDKELRAGLVGYGKIARDQHVPAMAATPGIRLVAVADPVTHAEGFASYPGLEAMLAGEAGLDAVIMCQPPAFRDADTRLALAAGKHVFLEKPPGLTAAAASGLASLAERAEVTLFAGWHSQQASGVDTARAFLADAQIISVEIDWKEDVRVWHPGQTWIWRQGGFGVFDPAINALSILTAIMPEPVAVRSAELDVPANCATPIAARVTMATSSGVPVTGDFDFLQTGPQSWDIRIATDRGDMLLSHGGNRLAIGGQACDLADEAEYPRLYQRFVSLVGSGRSDIDLAPLQLVDDAFRLGRVRSVGAFVE